MMSTGSENLGNDSKFADERPRFAWGGVWIWAIIALLLGWAAYDLYPLVAAKSRQRTLARMAGSGARWPELRKRLEQSGYEIQTPDTSGQQAIVIDQSSEIANFVGHLVEGTRFAFRDKHFIDRCTRLDIDSRTSTVIRLKPL